jgi:hypothetical protein
MERVEAAQQGATIPFISPPQPPCELPEAVRVTEKKRLSWSNFYPLVIGPKPL